MKRWARWTLGAISVLASIVVTVVIAGNLIATARMQRIVNVAVKPVALPTDATSLERGRHIYASRACIECHGADGAGRTVIDSDMLKVVGPHISPGPGSVTASYRAEDWVRTIRHGVKPDGHPAMAMPSEDFNRLTDADLGALVAYIQNMPAVEGSSAVVQFALPARLMYAAGVFQDAASKIDHSLPPELPVREGPTPEHGRYVAQMCIGCHGPGLSGGKIPGAPPDWPVAANLTPGDGSSMLRYADASSFGRMFKSGQRPDGRPISVMPFESLRVLNDTEVQALYAYLKTLAPRPAGGR